MNVRSTCMMVTLIFLIMSFSAWADDTKTGPRPGEKNPIASNKRVLFHDDELFVLFGDPGHYSMDYRGISPESDDLSKWGVQETQHEYDYLEFGDMLPSENTTPPVSSSAKGRFTRHDIDQTVYGFVRPDGKGVGVEIWDVQDGRHSNSTTVPAGPPLGLWLDGMLDIVAGDLDRLLDDEGYSHDEVVVASLSNSVIMVDVLDSSLSVRAHIDIPLLKHASNDIMQVSATLGDFNQDSDLDIAVAQSLGKQYIQINVLSYDTSGTSPKLINRSSLKTVNYGNYADITAGDFTGNGREEIAMATFARLRMLAVDDHWVIREVTKNTFDVGAGLDGFVPVKLVSGLFRFSPEDGYHFNRRQLALCNYARGAARVRCRVIQVADDYTTSNICVDANPDTGSCEKTCDWSFELTNISDLNLLMTEMDVTVGNFIGHGAARDNVSPLDQIAVYYFFLDKAGFQLPRVQIVQPNKECYSVQAWQGPKYSPWGWFGPCPTIMAITSADIDGDSYVLGDPVHVRATDAYIMDYVIQEPPKHIDYLPVDPAHPEGDWEVINISEKSGFYVELSDSQSTTFKTTGKDTSNWSIGGSASVSAEGSITFGNMQIAGVKLSAESTSKLSYNCDSSEDSWNSQYGSQTVSFTGQTNMDDFIVFKMQDIDIWRYKILGFTVPDKTAPNGYVDIVLPGPKKSYNVGGMTQSDWYQPVHQNGNILSYPSTEAKDFPPNLGSFTLPDGTEVNETMNAMSIYSWDGTSKTLDVEWTSEAGYGCEKSYNHTLGESEEIKTGVKAKGIIDGTSVVLKTNVDVSFNNENSWGGKETEECTNSESKGIKINVPSSSSRDQGYTFKSAVYVDSGTGALKVAHAANPLGSGSGSQWWTNQYNRLPDPALNLPNRFYPQGDDQWILNTDNKRMEMRGFFLRKGEVNPVSGVHEILSGPPTDGDIVQLCARVYNFSLGRPTGEFNVLFEVIEIDDGGFEVGTRETVGTARVSLDSLEQTVDFSMKEVCVDWDTAGKASQKGYRFYVTVDPDGEVEELHEWKDSTGAKVTHGNNEGYWPWGYRYSRSGPEQSCRRTAVPGPEGRLGSQLLWVCKGNPGKGVHS